MNTSTNPLRIIEYEGFVRGGSERSGFQSLNEKTFDALESFILANRSANETDASEILFLSARRGLGKTITARNYVGVISMTDGTVIEILPKICGSLPGTPDESAEKTRTILLEMLRTIKDAPFKTFNRSNLKVGRMNVLEIFIAMFVSEVNTLVKQGLRSVYNSVEDNERFLRGKLLTAQDIKHNPVNKARFFIRYDSFNLNRAENRLIKATLLFLKKKTAHERNKRDITRLLIHFESIEPSGDYPADFAMCISDRSTSLYQRLLSWCKVFLMGNSFTSFAGKEIAYALLFPMEKVFESYVATKLRDCLRPQGYDFFVQNKHYSLFDLPKNAFQLRPDIVVEHEGKTIVLDTKWKILSDNGAGRSTSQSDMYQMYAYSKKYKTEKTILLYPYPGSEEDKLTYATNDGVRVEISLINLVQPDECFKTLAEDIAVSLEYASAYQKSGEPHKAQLG